MKIKHEALRFLLAGTALVLTYLLTNQTQITSVTNVAAVRSQTNAKKTAGKWVVASNGQTYKSH